MDRKELIKNAVEKLEQLTNESIEHFLSFPIKAINDWEMLNTLYSDYNVSGISEIRNMLDKIVR